MLDKYLKSFSRLRTDKNRKRWSALTTHQAPNKPFLLLSIMDLIAQGSTTQNFIEPSFELVETWNGYWNAFMPIGHRSTMAHECWKRIRGSGFKTRECRKKLSWHILTLTDRSIFTPDKEKFYPAQDNLQWHRRNTFRK